MTTWDPRLPGHTITDWAIGLLTLIGAPLTKSNINFLTYWANTESGGYNASKPGGLNNPLNTTEGHFGQTSIHGDPSGAWSGQGGQQGNIKDYPSFAGGLAAQAYNLVKSPSSFGYGPILSLLRQGNASQADLSAAVNHSSFGTHLSGTGAIPPSASSTPGTGIGGVIPTPGGTISGNLPNPFGVIAKAGQLAGAFLGLFTDWRYVLEFFGGGIMVIMGIMLMTKDLTGSATAGVGPAIGKAGGAAAGAAAVAA